MHKRGMKAWVVPTALLAATCIKVCIGLGPYSGQCRVLCDSRGALNGLLRTGYTPDVR
jgi:hypothetical protein